MTTLTTMTNAKFAKLELYVTNACYGESIIVHLPNDTWGVIDCYGPPPASDPDPEKNPTLQFLIKRGVKELEFLCLTHPHQDHYRGMSHLLEHFPKIKYFWRSAGMSSEDLRWLVYTLKYDALERKNKSDEKSADELLQIFSLVNQGIKGKCIDDIDYMINNRVLQTFPITLQDQDKSQCRMDITAIAPCGKQIQHYQNSLKRCFDSQEKLKLKPPALRHNDISGALLIEYGDTSIILGGDVEKANWQDLLSDPRFDNQRLATHAVKVSHHGSETGYTPDLWQFFSTDQKPYGVVTPSERHGLPKYHAIQHLKNYTRKLMTTCLDATSVSTDVDSSGFDRRVRDSLEEFFDTVHVSTDGDSDAWEIYLSQAQDLLRAFFNSAHTPDKQGMCVLRFDHQGRCEEPEFYGTAGYL